MKQIITIEQWNELTPRSQEFITLWKEKKGYPKESPLLNIGQCIELLIAISYSFRHDDFLHGTNNNCLVLTEVQIGWDGDELIDILWFSIKEHVKKRVNKTFNEPIPDLEAVVNTVVADDPSEEL